jgi:hypothetical protein
VWWINTDIAMRRYEEEAAKHFESIPMCVVRRNTVFGLSWRQLLPFNAGEHVTVIAFLSSRDNKSNVTDEDLRFFNLTPFVQAIGLHNTQIKGSGLVHFSKLPILERVNLRGTTVTDESILNLMGASSIKSLGLSKTKITDRGVANLYLSVPQLEDLHLNGTAITDESLVILARFPRLKTLRINRTATTQKALDKFLADCPTTDVSWNPNLLEDQWDDGW